MNNNPFSKNAKSIRFKALCFTLVVHFAIFGAVAYNSGGGQASDLLPELPDFVKEYFEGDQKDDTKKDVKKKKRKRSRKPQA